ncbi:MAG: hypothetical protein N3E41_03630 [Thermofilaceae archaeon]|nr:hypothetical protein [Thermofilaceae archaeon]
MEEATLFVDDGEESKAAEAELAKRGIRYRRVDISVNGLRGWLLFEYGTAKAPILVDGNSVFIGLEEIKKVLR